jgi:hypothetical protein
VAIKDGLEAEMLPDQRLAGAADPSGVSRVGQDRVDRRREGGGIAAGYHSQAPGQVDAGEVVGIDRGHDRNARGHGFQARGSQPDPALMALDRG